MNVWIATNARSARWLPAIVMLWLVGGGVEMMQAQTDDPRRYDIGDPVPLVDLYVAAGGSDTNSGLSREQPLATLRAAWDRMTEFLKTGYRVNILSGELPCEGDCVDAFSGRHGTREHPIIIRAADGPGSVVIPGGLAFTDVSYLYLIDLDLKAGAGAPAARDNVLRIERSNNVLLRDLTLSGPKPEEHPENREIREVMKIGDCGFVYIEGCDIGGAYEAGVDFFSVRYGHALDNTIHDIDGWGVRLNGGSAYVRLEGNEISRARFGFQAGGGSNFEVLRAPWIHYEVYDIKFVNNLLHDIPGVPLGVAGGFNILLAYNTLYKVAYDANTAYALVQLTHGSRVCVETAENGENNADSICEDLLARGGWGVTSKENGGELIPNRSVYIFNNLFYNPEPLQTLVSHFAANSRALPPEGSNIPSPSHTDDNALFRGNLVWNGAGGDLLIVGATNGGEPGCDQFNIFCNTNQIRNDNAVNTMEPQLTDPAAGDYRPLPGGNLPTANVYPIPDFSWKEAPGAVPDGALSNGVPLDFKANGRPANDVPGAFTGSTSQASAPSIPSPLAPFDGETGVSVTPVLQWTASAGAGSYRVQVSTEPTFSTPILDASSVSATALAVQDLEVAATYYWRVRGVNSVGQSGWSEAWSFTTLGSVMTAPTLVFPRNGATDVGSTETLRWNPVVDAYTYLVHIDDDQTFSQPLIRRGGVTGGLLDIGGIAPGETYYWRVRAVNALGVSDWSEVWSFSSPAIGADVTVADEPMETSELLCYPNPIANGASIRFVVPGAAHVRLAIVNALGAEVALPVDRRLEAGTYVATWDASLVPSGNYTCVLRAGDYSVIGRVTVLR